MLFEFNTQNISIRRLLEYTPNNSNEKKSQLDKETIKILNGNTATLSWPGKMHELLKIFGLGAIFGLNLTAAPVLDALESFFYKVIIFFWNTFVFNTTRRGLAGTIGGTSARTFFGC